MSVLYANVLTYHVTITQLHSYGNGSVGDFYDEYGIREINDSRVNVTIHKHRFLSNPQKEALISMAPLGGLISFFPIAVAYNQMGFRRCFVMCAVLAIIPSLFVPICTSAKTFLLACVIRILQGFSLGVFLPYLCKMTLFIPINHVATPTIVFAYIPIAAFFAFPIFSCLAWSGLGWHSVHYTGCIATAIMFVIFMLINYDDEFKERAARESTFNVKKRIDIVVQDFRVWSVFIAALGYFTAINLYLTFGATFLNKACRFFFITFSFTFLLTDLSNSGMSSLFCRNTDINKLRFFNTVGTRSLTPFSTVFFPFQGLFIVASSMLGFTSCGFFRMSQLRSRQHHLFMLANLFLINCGSMFLTSLFNVLIAHNDDYSTWAAVLILHGAILILSNVVFCIFASAEPADWTKDGYEDSSIRPTREDPLPQRPL
ncbi:unnamed protein product [Nippostrongylus brasiliensis]|uniref:MFS domain-containing protein n=1 Tax=Nippostrongylus brasiliensis TaxID=27835 RepID=A0A0N4XG11_NIPBR|nr:unnamed protein product [Nippostrongylus brasiliensis]